ncbi:hypothetical protein BKA93DRAFT_808533 [Sparassis latifolia]
MLPHGRSLLPSFADFSQRRILGSPEARIPIAVRYFSSQYFGAEPRRCVFLANSPDLLKRRRANYRDEPTYTTLKMMHWEANVIPMSCGPRWKKILKVFQEYLIAMDTSCITRIRRTRMRF